MYFSAVRPALALGPAAAADPEVRAAVLNGFGDPEVEVHRAAAEALEPAAVADPEARTALLSALAHADVFVRAAAAKALGPAAAANPEARAALFKALQDQEQFVRRTAAEALGPAAVDLEARAALLTALGDSDAFVRRAAAQALGASATADPQARGALLRALGDPDESVRTAAVGVLNHAASKLEGSDFSEVLKALLRALNRGGTSEALTGINRAVAGRPLPGYRWVPLAERAKRRRRWNLIRQGIYVVSFALLAAVGLAAMADQLPTDSIWLRAGGILVILLPTVLALIQLYDRVKRRLV